MIWNTWRQAYQQMTFKDQQKFYDTVLAVYSEQQSFSVPSVFNFINSLSTPVRILELGGYKGELATVILSLLHFKIKRWINYEITSLAKDTACSDSRYSVKILKDYLWNTSISPFLTFNTFIASHVIEHLSGEDFQKLIDWLPASIENVYLQAPLVQRGTDYLWEDYMGSHILELGWKEVMEMMNKAGFIVFSREGEAVAFKKKKEEKSGVR